MKKISVISLFIFILGFVSSCNESEVVPAPELASYKEVNESDAKKANENLLKEMKVSGTLADGRTFEGKVTVTSFGYDEVVKGLLVNGTIRGIAKSADGKRTQIQQAFTGVEATLASGSTATGEITAQAECQILFLEIGPIFLDLLGLQVDLSQIILDITAVSGAGNLLGNLLCAVAGLLDPLTGLLNFLENLGLLLDLLGQINDLLASL